jgi:hypothetical protein
MLTALALCLTAASAGAPSGVAAPASAAPGADEWVALSTPSLCSAARTGSHPAALADARHVRLSNVSSERDSSSSSPRLPVDTLVQMLTEESRARGLRLEFFRGTSGLLARGDANAIAAANERIAELDRARAIMDVELSVRVTAGSAAATSDTHTGATSETHTGATATSAARVASGEEAFFGVRDSHAFISGYSVEVAADSGVAQPALGSASTGTTVHVRAARVEGGKRVHLSGVFDVAELAEVATFDPQNPDLGIVQEPTVKSAQACFAGVVESGGVLEVKIHSSALSQPDWTLAIQASTQLDEPPSDATALGWTVIDCAFLALEPMPLSPARPGSGLDHRLTFSDRAPSSSGMPPSAIAAALESASDAPSGMRQPIHWSNSLLFVPRADPAVARSALSLARGAEALRLSTGRVTIERSGLRVDLPVSAGFPARVFAGAERPYVVGYAAEVAPQTWVAAPTVELACDGLCVDIDASRTAAQCAFWIASSGAAADIQRKDAQLGRMQLLSRSLRADGAHIAADEPPRSFLSTLPTSGAARPPEDALSIAYRTH